MEEEVDACEGLVLEVSEEEVLEVSEEDADLVQCLCRSWAQIDYLEFKTVR